MAKVTLAVLDSCASYVERFLSYAGQRRDKDIRIIGFTEPDILAAHMQDKRIDALLISPEAIPDIAPGQPGDPLKTMIKENTIVFLLGEKAAAEDLAECYDSDEENKRFFGIDRYQPAGAILSDIRESLRSAGAIMEEKSRKSTFSAACIYSPADKICHPDAAYMIREEIGMVRGEYDIKTLYINLEQFSGLSFEPVNASKNGMSDVLYIYRTDPENLRAAIEEHKGRYKEMDVLSAPLSPEDLEELDRESWPDFLEAAAGAGDYQLILIDMAVFSHNIMEAVFEYGDLYIPALPYSEAWMSRSVLTKRKSDTEAKTSAYENKIKEFRDHLAALGYGNEDLRIRELSYGTSVRT